MPGEESSDEMDIGIDVVRRKYADFDEYAPEIARIQTSFANNSISAAEYIEVFYLAAKYASFSQARIQGKGWGGFRRWAYRRIPILGNLTDLLTTQSRTPG